jgi:diaminopimelate decarboxylase
MDHFEHRDGELWCEQVPLAGLADAVGTPAYVYSTATIRDHVRRLKEAFGDLQPRICYAVKANGCLAVLRLLADAGCGFDIVSGGELARIGAIGADPDRVVFSGVGKTVAEMDAALRFGVGMFNVESEEELDVLHERALALGATARIAIRVNPDVDPKTHRHITTGMKENKFGVDLARGEALARRALDLPALRLVGMQCHIGSQIVDVAPYRVAVERTAALAVALRAEAPDLEWLNMGGGYGIYYGDRSAPGFGDYAEAVRPVVAETGLRLMMEPGRVIVGNAGALLTRVVFNKTSGARRFVIVDAGMNDLIRPGLYEGYHRIWPARGAPPPPLGEESADAPCDIVGPVCESTDFLAKDRPLPAVAREDVLAVMSVGAYAATMASNYNDRPRAPEVLVDGDRYAVVRERESHADRREDLVNSPRAPAAAAPPDVRTCRVKDFVVGDGTTPLLIAGPCVIEGRDMALRHAEAIRDIAAAHGFHYCFKSSFDKANRTSVDSFRGPGLDEGLAILAEVRRDLGVAVLTDFHTAEQAAPVGEVVDVLQVPAFLCRQTDLLVAAAKTGKAVNVKKGQFLAPENMGPVVGKLEAAGCKDLMLVERGVSFGYGNLVVDFRSLPIMRRLGYPVIFDATHSVQRPGGLGTKTGGDRTEVPPLARAAAAVGVDGFFMEVHENPDAGKSDAANMLALETLGPLLDQLQRIRAAVA